MEAGLPTHLHWFLFQPAFSLIPHLALHEQCGSEVQKQSTESLMWKECVDHVTLGKQSYQAHSTNTRATAANEHWNVMGPSQNATASMHRRTAAVGENGSFWSFINNCFATLPSRTEDHKRKAVTVKLKSPTEKAANPDAEEHLWTEWCGLKTSAVFQIKRNPLRQTSDLCFGCLPDLNEHVLFVLIPWH